MILSPFHLIPFHLILFNLITVRLVPAYAALVRRALITPTSVHFKTPSVEQTSRVLRKYSDRPNFWIPPPNRHWECDIDTNSCPTIPKPLQQTFGGDQQRVITVRLRHLLVLATPGSFSTARLSPSPSNILHSAHTFHLTFEVLYQLEVCISHGLLNKYNITSNFSEELNTFEMTGPA